MLHNAQKVLKDLAVKSLRRCANDLAVVQKEQVAEAFKNQGQPSKKWPPLWADSFVGDVPRKARENLNKAQSSFYKAMHSKKPDSQKIARAHARLDKAIEKLKPSFSYRKGGQRLFDAGHTGTHLAGSFFIKHNFVFEAAQSIIVTIASSSLYAKWQQDGVKTRGPNFIPLTLKARREHQKGVNPAHEGLEYGVDYIMAWKGVNVPASPMIDYSDPVNKKQIDDTILLSLKPR